MAEALVERADLLVTEGEAEAQLVLHCDPSDAAAIAAATGIALPPAMLRVVATDQWRALHLAPDEWLLIGPPQDRDAIVGRIAAASEAHSLVDVGERSRHVRIEGRAATTLINTGCPLDLDSRSYPPGACTRALCGKVTVVLERDGPDCFRMHYGRSFGEYVAGLIRTAAQDLPETRPS